MKSCDHPSVRCSLKKDPETVHVHEHLKGNWSTWFEFMDGTAHAWTTRSGKEIRMVNLSGRPEGVEVSTRCKCGHRWGSHGCKGPRAEGCCLNCPCQSFRAVPDSF